MNILNPLRKIGKKIKSLFKNPFKKKEEPSYNLPTIIIYSDNDFYDDDPYISNIHHSPTASDDPSQEMKDLEEILNQFFKDADQESAFDKFRRLQGVSDSLTDLPINNIPIDKNKQLTLKDSKKIEAEKKQAKNDLRIKLLKGKKGFN